MQDQLDLSAIVNLAKRHARSLAFTCLVSVTSFLVAIAYFDAVMDSTEVTSNAWFMSFAAGAFFASLAYGVVYVTQAVVPARQVLNDAYGLASPIIDEPEPEPEPEPAPVVRPAVQPRRPPVPIQPEPEPAVEIKQTEKT